MPGGRRGRCPRGPISVGVLAQGALTLCSLAALPSPPPGPAEDGPRAVFMVDLWHPHVAAAERQALDFIFAPGR